MKKKYVYDYQSRGKLIECACGCGGKLTDRTSNNLPRRFLRNHSSLRGERSVIYKTGKEKTSYGYIKVTGWGHPRCHKGKVFEHILVMEKAIGRYLKPGEFIHHKNHIRDDNRLENLEIIDKSTHCKLHAAERRKNNNKKCIWCNELCIKDGFRKGEQYWKCGTCGQHFSD